MGATWRAGGGQGTIVLLQCPKPVPFGAIISTEVLGVRRAGVQGEGLGAHQWYDAHYAYRKALSLRRGFGRITVSR